jgi:hypothetical protein
MTSRECREQADRFAALSLEGGISVRRATILMAIADRLAAIAHGRFWPDSDLPRCLLSSRYRVKSGP